ncbi:MAG: UvrD-helicase domain-containing protein [Chloroflexi bacterium]|nr:UvrD-helicase domain-containing protein [Chloroflexota bacterium]
MAVVIDQAERNRIGDCLDQTLFVEAGAGTGKTEALVGRIVNLIANGEVTADRIAAITFTEKAAAELSDRILERLDELRESETDALRQERFAQAAEDLDAAAIETLHAFAARILRMHPIDAGLPPGYSVIDESEASIKFAERWSQFLDELLEDESLADHLLAAFDSGVQINSLRSVAQALHEDWDRAEMESARLSVADADPQGFIDELERAIELGHRCTDESDRLFQRLTNLTPLLQQLQERAEEPGQLVALLRNPRPSLKVRNTGRKDNWPPDVLDEVRDRLTALEERRESLRLEIASRFLVPIYQRLRGFVIDYADERRKRGELEFQDLLVRASGLLNDNEAVAATVRDRFRRLLIDEFQDNDPLQTQIADAIAGGEEGRLFFVGDPKQSIYRFRRADIRQFNSVKNRREQGLVRLSQNFRSAPGVTEFVNAIFEPMMQAGSQQAEWDDLRAYRPPLDEVEHPVTVVGGAYDLKARDVRAIEADGLARLIGEITDAPWQVFDKALNRTRDARFADTAVLVPTRTGLSHLLPELDAQGIPYRLESRSLVYHSSEVRVLLNLLRAIDDPTDQIALVAALKSPAFACADDDLYRWSLAGGRWDYRRPAPADLPPDDPVAESMRWLGQATERRWTMSVSELVGFVVRERRLLELAVVERQPREHWQRYRFMIDQARAFSDRGGATLSEFLRWAQHQSEQDTRVIESVVPEEDHDAVRIMTIHAAKGLEFPIVVFLGLNVLRRIESPTLLWHDDNRPEVRFGNGLETQGFGALQELDKKLDEEEVVRRNYVGATRARDHLVLSVYRREQGRTDAHAIAELLTEVPDRYRFRVHDMLPDRLDPPDRSPSVEGESAADGDAQRTQWLERRREAVRRLASLPRESATGLARRAGAFEEHARTTPNDEPDDELPPWRRGRAGTAIGRATHGVLQIVDLADWTTEEIDQDSAAQSAAESLNKRQVAEVGRLVRTALDSATVREAVSANRYWRELYAAVEVDGVLLDGFIDLLYETADGELVVVDYKTDALREGEAVDAAVARYRLQTASYALMLEQALGRRVARCILLFLHPDEAREVDDLPGAIREVREALRSREET